MVENYARAGYYTTAAMLGLAAVVWSTFGFSTAAVSLSCMLAMFAVEVQVVSWLLQ